MKFSLNWLKDYVALDEPVDAICRAVTFLGFEVDGVSETGAPALTHVVVGEVRSREKHPNADKLSICRVDVGAPDGEKTIVCGAQNFQVGDRVPVALPGAVLPGDFVIKRSKIRGEASEGMMCSAKELNISEDADGLLILPDRPVIGTPINEVLPPGDVVLDVEITPNRPDCLSHLGLARELAAWFKRDLKYPQERFRGEPTAPARPDLLKGIRVDAPEDCPLYTAHVITGVKIGPSPAWLQERLRAVGLRPINNVVDVGNYVMLETGQPLHAFDAARIGGAEIFVRRAVDGERIVTLDERERSLTRDMLVIADAQKPVVIAGIMGGEDSGVAESTTDLVLECAVFRQQSVRATSRHLGLTSDSAYRYERGVDPHGTLEAAWRAIDLIRETAGGEVAGPVQRSGSDVPWSREVVVTSGFIRERLGFDVPDGDMREALESLELAINREEETEERGLAWTVAIPSWRTDLDRPIDLVEEVLRLYGTERIPAAVLTAPGLLVDDDPVAEFNRTATDYLVGHDFHECVNYTLRSAEELETWVSETSVDELALENPFVEGQSHLRPTLVLGLLETLRLNQSRGVSAARLAETGRVFLEVNGQNLECASAAFLIAVDPDAREWRAPASVDFFTAKHHTAALAALAGIRLSQSPLVPVTGSYFGWQPGHSAGTGDPEQGWTARFGLLNLAMVQKLGIKGKVYAGVFSIRPELLREATAPVRFEPFSHFPAALRDLAVLVDRSVPATELLHSIEQAGRKAIGDRFALEQVSIFDVYEGEGLPKGKKSLAFSLAFRAGDRTLKDEEVNAAFNALQEELIHSTGCQIRK